MPRGGDGTRRVSSALALGLVISATIAAVTAGVCRGRRGRQGGAQCGPGFVGRRARCVAIRRDACPRPLVPSASGCEAPDLRVWIPMTTLVLGPSDWEAEGRVAPRSLRAGPFQIDAFEVTQRRWLGGAADAPTSDGARAASGMTRDEAAAFCARQMPAARLPTEDEWIVAAVAGANPATRYPWGDTGAVCRRAAWGLSDGPCAADGDGPDTVGAHPDGDSPLGLHDVAGNVAEWVIAEHAEQAEQAEQAGGVSSFGVGIGVAKGGSWKSALAADLRIWARLELPLDARDVRVGFRCLYPY